MKRFDEPKGLEAPKAGAVPLSWQSILTSAPARWRRKPLAVRLGLALVVVALAFLARMAIVGTHVVQLTYLTFYPAVSVAGLFGGAIAGAVTAVLSAIMACVWIDPPDDVLDWLGLGLFLGGSALIVGSAELLGQADSKSKVAETLDNITNAVFAVDRSFIVTFVNRESERISGRRREELVGRSVWECLPGAVGTGFQRRCEHVMMTGSSISCEEFNAPMRRWFDVNICRSDGGIAVYFHDITDRKRATAALHESEERLRLALRSGKIGTWEWNATTNQTTWDARACEIYGYPPQKPANRELFMERVHPNDRNLVRDAIERAFTKHGEYEAVYRVIFGGAVRWVASRGAVSVNAQGQPLRVIGVAYDVTESKNRERNLAFLGDLQKAFNTASSVEDTVRVACSMIAQHLELTHSAFIDIQPNQSTCTVIHDHNRPGTPSLAGDRCALDFYAAKDFALLETGGAVVVADVCLDPRTAAKAERFKSFDIGSFVNANYIAGGTSNFVLHAARGEPSVWLEADIELLTELAARVFLRLERARSEAALAESQQRLDLALSGAGLGVWDWNIASNSVRFDARWGEMIGYAPDEVEGNFAFWEDRVHPDDLPKIMPKLMAHLNGQTESFAAEHRMRHKSGEWVWLLSCGRVFERDAEGMPRRAVGVHVNISEQKRSEAALREREELLRAATDHASVGLVSLDLNRRYTFANPAYANIFELGPVDLLGQQPADALLREFDAQALGNIDRAYAGEHVVSEFKRARGRSAELRHYTVVYEPEFDSSGTVSGVVIVFFDITERKRAEQRQALLIRELDHRVKNVLARMSVVIARSREGASSIDSFLNAIEGRIHSMAKTHSRLSRNQWTGVSLSALVGDELEPYRTAQNTNVSGDAIDLGPDAAQVVSMVLHELATNAAKYGALATANGRVAVAWREEDRGEVRSLVLVWQESGVGAVQKPVRVSYGTEVIRELVRYELGGNVQLQFGPDGFGVEFVIPSARAVERRGA